MSRPSQYALLLVCTALVAFAAGCSTEKSGQQAATEKPASELPAGQATTAVPGATPRIDDLANQGPLSTGEREHDAAPADERFMAGNEGRNRLEKEPARRAAKTDHIASQARPGPTVRTEQALKQVAGDVAFSHVQPVPPSTPVPVQNHIRMGREPLYRENYARPDDHRVIRVSEQSVSTFSIDVDTGAYANMRRWLNQGQLPPEDAVRVEEFINYFDYAYAPPDDSGQPFAAHTELAPTPWNPGTHLLRIGIQGYHVPPEQVPPSNLVFLVDVSGSMRSNDKLPLLKQALGLLVNELDANDRIAIVVYAGASGMALQPTAGSNKAAILGALQQLEAGGSTNGAAGIRLAYQLAQQHFITGGVNRVILATDGDFNVGLASTDELIDLIQRKREAGIALTTLGFGTGNYNDHLLEQLADEGNGNYAYIDRLSEARKVLSEEMSATLMTIAKDVKIQVEFNPATVSEYRLIGYENRILNEEDFNNDRVDAGEIGAGHRVTALYEVSLTGSGYQRLPARRYQQPDHENERRDYIAPLAEELAHLRIRYKPPAGSVSTLIETPILRSAILDEASLASDDFRFAAAVAAFGQKLRGGQYLESWGYANIAELARHARGADAFGYRSEFLQLVALADSLHAADRLSHATPDDAGH